MNSNALPPSLLYRCWRWGLLPSSFPAVSGNRSDQCGWHCPLLRSGRCPLLSLSGLLQKCRLLHWPDTARNISHPALVRSRVIAVYQHCGATGLTVHHHRAQQFLLLPRTMSSEVMVPGSCYSPCRCAERVAIMLGNWLNNYISPLSCIFNAL